MLEIKRLELERSKVRCAMEEMEFRIMERMEDIKRIELNIENQKTRIADLDEQIKKLKGE